MAYSDAFKQQVQSWLNQESGSLQGDLTAAQRNARVWEWGGSGADADYWNTRAGEVQNKLNLLKNNGPEMLNKLQQGNIGQESFDIVKQALRGDTISNQQIQEAITSNQQLVAQNKQLADFRGQLEQQQFGGTGLNLSQALTSTGGDLGNLNKFLGQQEAQTFNTQLKPLIQMALGGRGLSDSGAQIELQSKALAQLDQQRQQSMMQAALGARSQIQGVERSDILGNIGFQQQQMNNQFDLARTGITMQFQQQLEQQREQLALELSARQGGGPGLFQQVLGGMGAGASIAGAPFTGGASLAALPSFLGYGFGPQAGMAGAGGYGLGNSFFNNNAGTVSRSKSSAFNNPYYTPGYGMAPWR